MERVEDAIYGKDLTSERGENLWGLMDRYSAADYWWIQEFIGNRDAFATPSTYLYKLRDTENADGTVTTGKLYWGPLWDFDFVWGELFTEGFDNANANANASASWIARLRQDGAFVDLLKERWKVLDGILEQVTVKDGLLDQYVAEMKQSWEGNQKRWPKEETTEWEAGSYEEAIEELRKHIDDRRAWINANLDQLPTTYCSVTFIDGDTEVLSATFRQGEAPEIQPPEMYEREGLLWLGWLLPDGKEYDPYEKHSEDITVRATYVDPSSVTAAQDIFFSFPEIWINRPTKISYDLMPYDAVDTRIVWTSSDESVVTVDEDGIVRPADGCLDGAETASATITATLVGSGKSASFRVVVYNYSIQLPQPDDIQLKSPMTLEVGAYQQVSIVSTPYPNALYANNDLQFEIEDEEIAEVSKWGVVTAKRPGTTSLVVKRSNRETFELEVVGTVTVIVTESASGSTPEPNPTPKPVPGTDATPTTDPTSSVSPSSKQVAATGTAALPKAGDETVPFATVIALAVAGGISLLLARKLHA